MPSPNLSSSLDLQPPRDGARKPVRVIAITGGKGGVGKTNVSVNLAMTLAASGQRTLLLDTDLALANVDVLLGLSPVYTLADVIEGRCGLEEIILNGPHGLGIVPASSGKHRMAELSPAEYVGLIRAFSDIDRPLDVMVVDTAAGISDSVLTFCQAAQDIIVTVCNEPASITDAYALIKLLSRDRGVQRIHVLASMTQYPGEGKELFEKLLKVSERFLDVVLDYAGAIPHDEWLRRAVQRQQAVVDAFPSSPSAIAFRDLANRANHWQAPIGPRGGVEFFIERLVGSGAAA